MAWKNYYKQFNCFMFTSRIFKQIHLLRFPLFKMVIVERINFYRKYYSIKVHGYVIMDNHFHIIISNFDQPSENLLKFNQNLLRTTSRQFVKILSEHLTSGISFAECDRYLETFKIKTRNGNGFKVWEGKSRGVPIWNRKMFEEKLNYIHFNPVKAKMVKKPEDYLFSSARYWLDGSSGLLEIDPLPSGLLVK